MISKAMKNLLSKEATRIVTQIIGVIFLVIVTLFLAVFA